MSIILSYFIRADLLLSNCMIYLLNRKLSYTIQWNVLFHLDTYFKVTVNNQRMIQFAMSVACEKDGEKFAIPINVRIDPNKFQSNCYPDIFLCDDAS